MEERNPLGLRPSTRARRTDPVENLRCYIMVHGGVDRHDRLIDAEWVERLVKQAREVAFADETSLDQAINELRRLIRE